MLSSMLACIIRFTCRTQSFFVEVAHSCCCSIKNVESVIICKNVHGLQCSELVNLVSIVDVGNDLINVTRHKHDAFNIFH